MSLTKEDLNAIGTLIDNKLDSRLKPLQADIKKIESRLYKLEEGQDALKVSVEKTIIPRLDRLEEGQDALKVSVEKTIIPRLDKLEESQDAIRASQVRVEAEYYPQVKGALDGIKGNTENIHLHGKRISALETKVENHGISMRILGLATT